MRLPYQFSPQSFFGFLCALGDLRGENLFFVLQEKSPIFPKKQYNGTHVHQ
jgi:hypothetical protein